MDKINPYKNFKQAAQALDNGGRFFNFMTKADDGEISPVELGKAAGIFSSTQNNILYLEMAISELQEQDKKKVLESLTEELRVAYRKFAPRYLLASGAAEKGVPGENLVIKGIPRKVDSETNFPGFIFMPIMTGTTMTFIMIPIHEVYDVYEIRDSPSGKRFLLAHERGLGPLPEEHLKIGGLLKELKNENEEASGKFLEVVYYM